MASTAIADIIDPEVLADQISAKFPDQLVLGNTSLVDVDSTIPLGSPGTKFKIPGWKRIPTFGPLTEGSALTPGKIQTMAEFAVVQRAGAAFEVYDTAQLVSKADPLAEINFQISRRAAEYLDAALVVEANKTPNVYDATGIGGGLVDQSIIAGAMTATLGDNFAKLQAGGGLIMHSKVYGDILKTNAIQNMYQSNMDVIRTGVVPTLMGLPIFVSDLVTTTVVSGVNHYTTYIVGPGALALFYQRQVMVEFDRDTLSFSDIVSANVHFAPHLYGWDDDSNAQAAEQAKSIHLVAITSK